MVLGGALGSGDSQSARKRHARASLSDIPHVQPTEHLPTNTLTFSSGDDPDLHYPHNDPLVVTLTIANYAVKWVLIDTGSSSNILFTPTFNQFRISKDRL